MHPRITNEQNDSSVYQSQLLNEHFATFQKRSKKLCFQ